MGQVRRDSASKKNIGIFEDFSLKQKKAHQLYTVSETRLNLSKVNILHSKCISLFRKVHLVLGFVYPLGQGGGGGWRFVLALCVDLF